MSSGCFSFRQWGRRQWRPCRQSVVGVTDWAGGEQHKKLDELGINLHSKFDSHLRSNWWTSSVCQLEPKLQPKRSHPLDRPSIFAFSGRQGDVEEVTFPLPAAYFSLSNLICVFAGPASQPGSQLDGPNSVGREASLTCRRQPAAATAVSVNKPERLKLVQFLNDHPQTTAASFPLRRPPLAALVGLAGNLRSLNGRLVVPLPTLPSVPTSEAANSFT